MALITIELEQRCAVFKRLFFRLHLAKHLGALDLHPRRTGKMNFIAAVDANDANVLARRLCAAARTAGNSELDLMRGPTAPHHFLKLDAKTG